MIELTERECEVMNLLVLGKSNKEISKELIITPHTVKAHLDTVYRKLNVHNRVQATIVYLSKISGNINTIHL